MDSRQRPAGMTVYRFNQLDYTVYELAVKETEQLPRVLQSLVFRHMQSVGGASIYAAPGIALTDTYRAADAVHVSVRMPGLSLSI